ncbi:hypothetical protein UPYG_G00261700 [Umbra pygmaea]|uniref:BHLH domain-containing protein n=1 Tax=Umbra pygmaea TaxID=75934 RepID=A0ABD0W956_UMBPY
MKSWILNSMKSPCHLPAGSRTLRFPGTPCLWCELSLGTLKSEGILRWPLKVAYHTSAARINGETVLESSSSLHNISKERREEIHSSEKDPTTMDTAAFSNIFHLKGDHLLDCNALLEPSCPSSDPGYYSACSSLSPASTIDSCCLSPPCFQWGAGQEMKAGNPLGYISQAPKRPRREDIPAQEKPRRSRSKFPGKKRDSASEREKLRMRDLTKALHHLRTYLPPSVAPAGQTLTKIETLRLTIRYISHLSSQLGLSEDTSCLEEVGTTPRQDCQFMLQCPEGSSVSGQWCQERLQGSFESPSQYCLPVTDCSINTDPQTETDFLPSTVCYQDISLYQMHNDMFQ